MQFYTDPSREQEATALPDARVTHLREDVVPGYYWWPRFPDCPADGQPNGPFATEALAIADAREGGDV
jgi:hypothetical protein